ncbi:hypothetical protein AGMMS50256_38050 [Betaproteobacteria bacterium]|nr:hypothetical protein AGMMS50256_38050 [Betaproteobacteria bacterium]
MIDNQSQLGTLTVNLDNVDASKAGGIIISEGNSGSTNVAVSGGTSIVGDVTNNGGGSLGLNLDNAILAGSINNTGAGSTQLELDNNATWNVTDDSQVTTVSFNESTLNIAADKTIRAESFAIGSDTTLNITGYDYGSYSSGASPMTVINANTLTGNPGDMSIALDGNLLVSSGSILDPENYLDFSAQRDSNNNLLLNSTLAWNRTNDAHGAFNLANASDSFTVDADLADNLASTHYNGWDGKSLTKTGAGTLTLSGANTYTGNTTIADGTLEVTGTLGNGSYAGTIANAGTLLFNQSADQTLSGLLSRTGTLTKDGAGTLILTADNIYTGLTTISDGTLQIGDGGTSGRLIGDIAINNNAELIFNRTDVPAFIRFFESHLPYLLWQLRSPHLQPPHREVEQYDDRTLHWLQLQTDSKLVTLLPNKLGNYIKTGEIL